MTKYTRAKEIFISGLKNAIKEEIYSLKQLETCAGRTTNVSGDPNEEKSTFLQNVKKVYRSWRKVGRKDV